MYPNAHMSTSPHGKLRIGIDQRLHTVTQLRGRLRAEHTSRRHDLRVGPEVLRFILVDVGIGSEDFLGEGLLEGSAARGGRRGRDGQREQRGDAHGWGMMDAEREKKETGGF